MPPRRTLEEDYLDLEAEPELPPDFVENQTTHPPALGVDVDTMPASVRAFAAQASPVLAEAQRKAALLRMLSRQGAGFDVSGRAIAGLQGGATPDDAGAQLPVQYAEQHLAQANKEAALKASQLKEAASKAEREKLETKRDVERKEAIAREEEREAKRNKTTLQAAAIGAKDKAVAQDIERMNEIYKREEGLRKEFQGRPIVKEYESALSSYDALQRFVADPSPAADLGIVFNFMHLQDPGVSVMEGDIANVRNAAGVDAKVRAVYNSLVGGGTLAASQRADLLKQAGVLMHDKKRRYNAEIERYKALGEAAGAAPENVVPITGAKVAPPTQDELIRIRRKSDGVIKSLPADRASKYLEDPNYERAQ